MSRKIRFVNLLAAAAVLLSALVYTPCSFSAFDTRDYYGYDFVFADTSDYHPYMQFYKNTGGTWSYVATLSGWNASDSFKFSTSKWDSSVEANWRIDYYMFVAAPSSSNSSLGYIPAYSDFCFYGAFNVTGTNCGYFDASKIIKADYYLLNGGDSEILSSYDTVDIDSEYESGWVNFTCEGYTTTKFYGIKASFYIDVLDCTKIPLSKFTSDYFRIENTDDSGFYYFSRFPDMDSTVVPELNIPTVDDGGMVDINQFIPDSSNPLMIVLARFTNMPIVTIAFIVVSVIATVSYVLFGKRSN